MVIDELVVGGDGGVSTWRQGHVGDCGRLEKRRRKVGVRERKREEKAERSSLGIREERLSHALRPAILRSKHRARTVN